MARSDKAVAATARRSPTRRKRKEGLKREELKAAAGRRDSIAEEVEDSFT
jgi:hypothetical protein